jgi:hypothetical protein
VSATNEVRSTASSTRSELSGSASVPDDLERDVERCEVLVRLRELALDERRVRDRLVDVQAKADHDEEREHPSIIATARGGSRCGSSRA